MTTETTDVISSLNLQASATVNVKPSTALEIKKIIELIVLTPEEPISAVIWGQPGVGKTQLVETIAKEHDFYFDSISLAQMIAGDLQIPAISDTPYFNYKYNPFFQKAIDWCKENPTKKAIILLDELGACAKDIMAQTYQILGSHGMGDIKFPKNLRFVATSNRPEDGTITQRPMDSGTSGRLAHLWMVADLESWLEYAYEVNIHHYVTAYLKTNPSALMDTTNLEVVARPAPRSWTKISETLKNVERVKDLTSSAIETAIISIIGMEAGKKFIKSYQQLNKSIPDLTELWKLGESQTTNDSAIKKLSPKSLIVKVATVNGVINICASKFLSADLDGKVNALCVASRILANLLNEGDSKTGYFNRLLGVVNKDPDMARILLKKMQHPFNSYLREYEEETANVSKRIQNYG